MHHFFAGYYLIHKESRDEYIKVMEELYGEEGEKIARDSLNGARKKPIWESDDEVFGFPFYEKTLRGALA